MGKRGPAPRPSKILKLIGSREAGKRAELPSSGKAPAMPSWLDREAKAEWKRVTSRLEDLKILDQVDRGALAAYCLTWSQFYRAVKTVRKEGETFKTPAGYIQQHPAVAIINASRQALLKFYGQFGLSPSGRVGLSASEESIKDPLSDFNRMKHG